MRGKHRRPGERISRRWWLVLVRWRNVIDRYRIGWRSRWRHYGSVVGFALGLVGVALAPIDLSAAAVVGLVGTALGFGLLVPEMLAMRQVNVTLRSVPNPRFRSVPPTAGYQVVTGPKKNHAVASDAVDAILPTSTARVTWSKRRVLPPEAVTSIAYDVLRQRDATRTLFNGKVIRQHTELTAAGLREGQPVAIGPSDYFTLVCTNYLTEYEVRTKHPVMTRVVGPKLLLDPHELRLATLDQSRLANAVGVSTLAFTIEGLMVLVGQSTFAQASPDLYAPAGSGSLDLRDIQRRERATTDLSLVDLVRRGMRRELCEESMVEPHELGDTVVTGYFRWLNKGGKPEYVGVTRLNLSADELERRHIRLTELHYVSDVFPRVKLDLQRLRDSPTAMTCLDTEYRYKVSFPLYMCLRALGMCLNRDDEPGERARMLIPRPA